MSQSTLVWKANLVGEYAVGITHEYLIMKADLEEFGDIHLFTRSSNLDSWDRNTSIGGSFAEDVDFAIKTLKNLALGHHLNKGGEVA